MLPYFDVVPLPPLELKGKGATLPAYRVLSRTAVRTRFEASMSRGLAPFVGRRKELRELQQRLQQSRAGQPQVVQVIGDAGLGKTRLIAEFLSSQDNSVRIFRTYCDRDSAIPLQPFIQMLRRYFRIDQAGDTGPPEHVIQEQLQDAGPEAAALYPTYLKLLSLSGEGGSAYLQPQQIAAAIVALLRDMVSSHTLMLFIDDWHWVDDLSRQVLGELVRTVAGLPIQFLLATRHDDLADRSLGGTRFLLDPFDAAESRKAVTALFSSGVAMGVVDSIYERSGGNVLFIEELCQSLLAADHTAEDRDQLLEVPATLHGLIESRIDRLPAAQQELIRIAAVMGNVFPTRLFERILGYQLPRDLMVELSHQDLLYLMDDKELLRFKHGLTRDVIYRSVTLRERQNTHRRVAELLQEEADESGGEEYYEALAYHYNGAGNDEQALHYAERAGDKALGAMALDRARTQYLTALDALERLDRPEEYYERWNAIAQRFGWACVFDPLPEQIEPLERALQLAQQHDDLKSQAKSEYWLGYINYALGRADRAVYHCERSLANARKLGEKGLEVHALATLAQALATRAQYSEALSTFDQSLYLIDQHKQGAERSQSAAYAMACRALIFADYGDFARGQSELTSAYKLVAGADTEMEGSICTVRLNVELWQGRWRQALEAAARAEECARKITSNYVLGMAVTLSAYARWQLDGDPDHIRAMMEATDWLEAKGKALFISLNFGYVADALTTIGDGDGARRYAARALQRVRRGDRLGEAMACRALARLAATGQGGQSVNHYLDRALASAQARDSRHERAVITLCRGELLKDSDPARARSLLEQAEREFSAMEMDWHRQLARSGL